MKYYNKQDQMIVEPDGGWKQGTWYLVDVSYSENNPIHRDLFFSGFLVDGRPSGYNALYCQGSKRDISNVYYMSVVKEVVAEGEYNNILGGMPPVRVNGVWKEERD